MESHAAGDASALRREKAGWKTGSMGERQAHIFLPKEDFTRILGKLRRRSKKAGDVKGRSLGDGC